MNHTKPKTDCIDRERLPSLPVIAAPESLETAVPLGSLAHRIIERCRSEKGGVPAQRRGEENRDAIGPLGRR